MVSNKLRIVIRSDGDSSLNPMMVSVSSFIALNDLAVFITFNLLSILVVDNG